MADVNAQIVSRAYIRDKARKAFFAGLPRSAHEMNWHSAALPEWLAEYDRCATQCNQFAIGAGKRVDAAQVSSC